MTEDKDRKSTLAAALDRTHWDYSSARDRRFLLAPLSRIFEDIAWEFKPRHDGTADGREDSEPAGETDNDNS